MTVPEADSNCLCKTIILWNAFMDLSVIFQVFVNYAMDLPALLNSALIWMLWRTGSIQLNFQFYLYSAFNYIYCHKAALHKYVHEYK